MTNSLESLIENFEQLEPRNRRTIVCRLKKKKLKLSQELKLIDTLLEKEKIQRKMRRELRDYKVSDAYRC